MVRLQKGIIDKLVKRIYPDYDLNADEEKWRKWVDNHLVHVLSPNIYRTVSEALESFEYIPTKADERVALYGAAEQWVDALKGREFLGGLQPNLADLAVFGVLRPIRHLKSG